MIVVMGERCPYCSQFFAAGDLMRFGLHVKMCRACYEKNQQQFTVYSDAPPPSECAECKTKFDDLPDVGGRVEMELVPKDGVLQLLCLPCAGRYLPKRVDLFKGTAFGRKVLNI